jgi:hypothetical protein
LPLPRRSSRWRRCCKRSTSRPTRSSRHRGTHGATSRAKRCRAPTRRCSATASCSRSTAKCGTAQACGTAPSW